MAKNALYWTAVCVGLLMVLFIFYSNEHMRIERFQAADTTTTTTTTTVATTPFHEVTTDPTKFATDFVGYTSATETNVYSYLSTYTSQTTQGGVVKNVYAPDENRWRDIIRNNDFTLIVASGVTVPATVRNTSTGRSTGLAMKGVCLRGPASTTLGANNQLGSFSVCLFAEWKSLDLQATDGDVVVFRAYAEYPYMIRWSLKYESATRIRVSLVVGDPDVATNTFTFSIPKDSYMMAGQSMVYTFSWDATTNKLRFFIGKQAPREAVINPGGRVVLGPSAMNINETQNMDADVKAVVIYTGLALDTTSVQKLQDYFTFIDGGASQAMYQAQNRINQIASQMDDLSTSIQTSNVTIETLRQQVQQCETQLSTTAPSNTPTRVSSYEPWAIQMDFRTEVVDPDINKCSFLKIQDFRTASSPTPVEQQIQSAFAGNVSAQRPFTNFDIVNPTRPSSSSSDSTQTQTPTPAATPASSTTSSSTTTPATAATTTTTTRRSSTEDIGFWRTLLDMARSSPSSSSQSTPATPTATATSSSQSTPATPTATTSSSTTAAARPTQSSLTPVEEGSMWSFLRSWF